VACCHFICCLPFLQTSAVQPAVCLATGRYTILVCRLACDGRGAFAAAPPTYTSTTPHHPTPTPAYPTAPTATHTPSHLPATPHHLPTSCHHLPTSHTHPTPPAPTPLTHAPPATPHKHDRWTMQQTNSTRNDISDNDADFVWLDARVRHLREGCERRLTRGWLE